MENRTVLIVDDDAALRRSNERMFRLAGWKTLIADGVQQAVELLPQADVVLSDYYMLDGTGADVVKHAGDTPVVILSGMPQDVKHKHVLCKPSDPDVILNTVANVLTSHERHSRR